MSEGRVDYQSVSKRGLIAAFTFAFAVYVILVVSQPIIFGDHFGLSSEIAGIDVSMKSSKEAKVILEKRWQEYRSGEINVGGTDVAVSSLVSDIKTDETVPEALNEEQGDFFSFSKYFHQTHKVDFSYNEEGISALLLQKYDEVAVAPVDAVITNIDKGIVSTETTGKRLLLTESREKVISEIQQMKKSSPLLIQDQLPSLTKEKATDLLGKVRLAVSRPVSISGSNPNEISVNELQSWIKITTVSSNTILALDSYIPKEENDFYYLDPDKVHYFVAEIGKGINKKPSSATLGTEGEKMVVLTPSITGEDLDSQKAIRDIQDAVRGDHKVSLTINKIKPEISEENLTDLGLTSLISEGYTDAGGSPVNRIHNYTVGASKFNGVLIKPGEDFSFNKTLGAVDASTGYLPELVILADKTVPEYGGGLCQVSSTAFRAALNAGLPILERHAHAYPVGYYKPYGVDATIYLPSPDLKFTNDTGKYILIQTRIVGTRLYFDFFGTKKNVTVKFSGNVDASGAVGNVEKVTPTLTEQDARGPKSFTSTFYRHIYDLEGKLTDNDKFVSKYDSPDKYPH